MKSFAVSIAYWCLSFGIIDKEQVEWCVYSIEKRITTIITWLFILLIGSVCFGVVQSVIFTLFFLFLRQTTNGYHATSYLSCLILSLAVEIIFLFIGSSISYNISIALLILSDVIIWNFAPSNNLCIHLDQEEMRALKTKSQKRLVVLNTVYFLLFIYRPEISNYALMGMLADALSLQKIKKGGEYGQ